MTFLVTHPYCLHSYLGTNYPALNPMLIHFDGSAGRFLFGEPCLNPLFDLFFQTSNFCLLLLVYSSET